MVKTEQQVRAAITQIAADWYVARRSGPLSKADSGAFFAWLKASPIHIEEYLGIAAVDHVLPRATENTAMSIGDWTALGRDESSAAVVALDPDSITRVGDRAVVRRPWRPWRPLRPWRPWLTWVAIGVLGVAGIALLWIAATKSR